MKLESTVEAFAVKVTGLPVRPVTVAVTVLIPGLDPVVQEPTSGDTGGIGDRGRSGDAYHLRRSPRRCTVTPPTPKLLASVTFTDGLVVHRLAGQTAF